MLDDADKDSFRTLRGFLDGEESDEPIYFAYSAALRIHGVSLPLDEITSRLGLQPTHIHCQGERRGPKSAAYKDDAWHYSPGLPEEAPLEHHLNSLWATLQPQVDYLKSLKDRFTVDIFCGYRSNCDMAGFEIPHTCLEMFQVLEVPFSVSIIIA